MTNEVSTSLYERIVRAIAITGPMPLSEFMQLCISDPIQGYYASQTALGAEGDFTTAPEISQVFGELMGIWCAAVWQAIGSPPAVTVVEIGPGRGTMMSDMLRAARAVRGFFEAANWRLVETSPLLVKKQQQLLAGKARDIDWVPAIDKTGESPLILVANEFLDALAIRQFIKTDNGAWHERCVALDNDGSLKWVAGATIADATILPNSSTSAPVGAVFEYSPARETWTQMLSEQISRRGGAALLIDYGHIQTGLGDTFQAVRSHRYVDPLSSPGKADLTAHVDFEAISRKAAEVGICHSPVVSQRGFLETMGIHARAQTLLDAATTKEANTLRSGISRLIDPKGMGSLFKVLALCDRPNHGALTALPPFIDN